jgi:hypothetical protein
MTDEFLSHGIPAGLIVLGAILNFVTNLMKVKDLELRVGRLEKQQHDSDLVDRILQQVRGEGKS